MVKKINNLKILSKILINFSVIVPSYFGFEEGILLTLKILSIICLLVISILYVNVPLLNDLTGKALATHCIFLALGYSLKIFNPYLDQSEKESWLNMLTKYCHLVSYAWLTIMWLNIYLVVHKCIKMERRDREDLNKMFVYGAIFCSICIPALQVIIASYLPAVCITTLTHGNQFSNLY